MRTLNEIVNSNAHFVMARMHASQGGPEEAERMFSLIGRRMRAFHAKASPRSFREIRSGRQPWNAPYMEAFCAVTGIAPEDLVSSSYQARVEAGLIAAANMEPPHTPAQKGRRKSARKKLRVVRP